MPPIPIIVLAMVFVLIATRRIGKITFSIWQVMLLGALVVVVTGQIGILPALKSINIDLMVFLFCMFVIGQALEESGLLSRFIGSAFKKARTADAYLLITIFGFGFLSAFLMNDTLAVVGTPAILILSRKSGINVKLMMLALAFSVTIGSAMSPIGNPQNLLIALGGTVSNPFIEFFGRLFIPTIINLGLAFLMLKIFYKPTIKPSDQTETDGKSDPALAKISMASLIILCVLIFAKIAIVMLKIPFDFKLTYIALFAMLPIVILSPKRFSLIGKIDWHTLIFFASMFILMQSVWNCGFFQGFIENSSINLVSISVILIVSVVLSQFLSNVPLVALYMPVMVKLGAGSKEMVALAAGSTIAGNMFILGAASTVMIIQNAEKRTGDTLTFFEFARIGVPMTVINIAVYWLFLAL